MVRRFLLPLLVVALFATEAATAQTLPADQPATKKEVRQAARASRRAGRTLTNREKKAAAKLAAAQAAVAAAPTTWTDADAPANDAGNSITHRPTLNVSSAPGMPLNQVGHGVTTDYDGRPLRPVTASTNVTLPTQR
ncbi:MAG: hypothetical protein ACRYFX_02195 [Janthinobacterium lividum]